MGKFVAGLLFLVVGAVAVQFYSGRTSLWSDTSSAENRVPFTPPEKKIKPPLAKPLVKTEPEVIPVRTTDLTVYGPVVSPALQGRLGFEEKGTLAQIKIKEGQVIKAGTEVMRLDTTQVEATIATKQAELALAETAAADETKLKKATDTLYTATGEYDAARRLISSRAISNQEYQRTVLAYQNAQSDVEAAKTTQKLAKIQVVRLSSELKEAKLALERHILRAPYDCQVIRILRDRNEYIKEGPVVQVANLQKMKVEGSIQEEAIGLEDLVVGMPVEITLAGSDKKFSGKLTFVDNVVIAGERRIIAEIGNEQLEVDGEVRWAISPGASVTALVKAGDKAASR